MRLCLNTDGLGHMSFEEMVKTSAEIGRHDVRLPGRQPDRHHRKLGHHLLADELPGYPQVPVGGRSHPVLGKDR